MSTSVDAQRDAHRLRRTQPTSPRAKYAGNRRVKWPDDSDRYSDAHDRYFDEKENVTVTDQKDGPGKRRPPAPSRGPIPTHPEALTLEVEEQLRRYDALLGMLHAEEGARLRAEERAASTAHDAAERVATAEASAQDAKRVAVEAKARVRRWRTGRISPKSSRGTRLTSTRWTASARGCVRRRSWRTWRYKVTWIHRDHTPRAASPSRHG